MKPVLVFYHCAFHFPRVIHGHPTGLRDAAVTIIRDQMAWVAGFGLYDRAARIFFCVNGGEESREMAHKLKPEKAQLVLHGTESISETKTIEFLENIIAGEPESYVLYFHSKGATHTDPAYSKFVAKWRRCMMIHLVAHWDKCVSDLESGFDSVGCHWMTNMAPPSDKDAIWGGNFWWATSKFLKTLPRIMDRELIVKHGYAAPIARMEAERWIGSGPSLPRTKDYHQNGIGACP